MVLDEFLKLLAGWFIIYGLAFMAALTDGPFGVFQTIRAKVKSTTKKEWIRTGVGCPICLSFWIGIPVSFALNGGIVMWLSATGFVCVITSLSPAEGSEE